MLFISQPLGTGFSYSEEQAGTLNPSTGEQENSTFGGVDGRYPHIDADLLGTTELAAASTWHVLQGFLDALPQLDKKASKPKTFNLWTESYGGHYGPAFYKYFFDHNKAIEAGTEKGTPLHFDTLGIGNGIINEAVQVSSYPEFAVNNTYGIKTVNDTVYSYMKFANEMPGGCLDQITQCEQANRTTDVGKLICLQATDQCRTNVEQPYYEFSGRGVYDIRWAPLISNSVIFDTNLRIDILTMILLLQSTLSSISIRHLCRTPWESISTTQVTRILTYIMHSKRQVSSL